MAAEVEEEIIVNGHGLGTEEGLPDVRDLALGGGSRSPGPGLGRRLARARRRQRGAVQLAAGEPWELRNRLDQSRRHVRGEPAAEARKDALFIDLPALARNHVADQLLHAGHVLAHRARRSEDAFSFEQHGLDLAQLHAEPAQLDLRVGAAQELDVPVRIEAAEVPRAVDARIRLARGRERVRHEPLARLLGKSHVPARHAGAADRDLADLAARDGPQSVVKQVHAVAGDGAADRDRLAG